MAAHLREARDLWCCALRTTVLAILSIAVVSGVAAAGVHVGGSLGGTPWGGTTDSSRVVRGEFGIMFGFPAILNIAVGWWPDPILGARVSGMYYGKAFSGIQGGLCFTLHRGARSRLAATFVVGTLRDEHESWTYVGPGLDSHLGPFLAEVVIGRGSGDLWNFRSVVPAYAFQLGLMGGGGILGPRAK